MRLLIFSLFAGYTLLLFLIMFWTTRKTDHKSYFTGNRKSPWFVVAYGMIGSSLSGVSFMSVPGNVINTHFTYFGLVIGFLFGYAVIALVLLPLYYRLNLTSIYSYLGERIGFYAHKTGSFFFIISRLLGSALRMYIVIFVLQKFIFDAWGIPLWATTICIIGIILLYTFQGGIKTIVWTDILQTSFMLIALILTISVLMQDLNLNFDDMMTTFKIQGISQIFNTDYKADNFFIKQIISGAFIAIAMTGLDQDMMQKNLSCKSLKDAQKNIFVFCIILVIMNFIFLCLGGLFILYAQQKGIDLQTLKPDEIYPYIAFNYLGLIVAICFIIGLISAGYSSADGTLTALTTSICYDFIQINQQKYNSKRQTQIRKITHISIAVLFLLIIIFFSKYHSKALINIIYSVASYTYGPLLGLFAFGLFTKRQLKKEYLVPFISFFALFLSFIIHHYSPILFNGYQIGFELLLINGLLTFLGLLLFSQKKESVL